MRWIFPAMTDTTVIDGGKEGDTIRFTIGGLPVAQTGTWHSGTNVELNLPQYPPYTPAATAYVDPLPNPNRHPGCTTQRHLVRTFRNLNRPIRHANIERPGSH